MREAWEHVQHSTWGTRACRARGTWGTRAREARAREAQEQVGHETIEAREHVGHEAHEAQGQVGHETRRVKEHVRTRNLADSIVTSWDSPSNDDARLIIDEAYSFDFWFEAKSFCPHTKDERIWWISQRGFDVVFHAICCSSREMLHVHLIVRTYLFRNFSAVDVLLYCHRKLYFLLSLFMVFCYLAYLRCLFLHFLSSQFLKIE